MLTSKQRAQLRGLANGMQAIFQVGKGGIGDALIKQVDDALEARELIKITVLENAQTTSRAVADEIAIKVKADVVQVIGSKFILYRESKEHKEIVLVK
ncbi:MAG: ribosome assembly RNA-binding protein YhbY [Clostridia bacterium]|nr:ribosome assembly RNA-binding protein YhbY [Clostridia bacterium]MBQ9957834.1 ribosome assembly RNA-binding protein YhbY [Clostridia bacterium]